MNLRERVFLLLMCVAFLLGFQAGGRAEEPIKVYKLSIPPDISIEWVKHASGQPVSSVAYDPASPLRLPILIAVKIQGRYCAASIGIRGIQVGSRAPVSPPIAVPRPDQYGMSYIRTFVTIPSGLPYGNYSFEVLKLASDACPDSNPQNDRKIVPIRLVPQGSVQETDYAIYSANFCDGSSLSKGILYSPDFPSPACLKVKVKWNKVPPPYGIQCNNKIRIWGFERNRRKLLVPDTLLPAPDANGISVFSFHFTPSRGLTPGENYEIRAELIPSDRKCDSNPANNGKNFFIPLVRMSGNDLTVRVTKKELVETLFKPGKWDLRVKFKIANISATDTLHNVPVRITYAGKEKFQTISTLPPKKWVEGSFTIEQTYGLICVEVNPDKTINELRYDNNKSCFHR